MATIIVSNPTSPKQTPKLSALNALPGLKLANEAANLYRIAGDFGFRRDYTFAAAVTAEAEAIEALAQSVPASTLDISKANAEVVTALKALLDPAAYKDAKDASEGAMKANAVRRQVVGNVSIA
jgi:hypothetical protein